MAATFRWTEQTDLLRLPSETPLPNVFLAGDWTARGLPATIEGPAFSGHLAAQRVMQLIHGNPSHYYSQGCWFESNPGSHKRTRPLSKRGLVFFYSVVGDPSKNSLK